MEEEQLEILFDDDEERDTPIVKEPMIARLTRMETRMVKYQESNAMQMRELVDTLQIVVAAMKSIAELLMEEGHGSSK